MFEDLQFVGDSSFGSVPATQGFLLSDFDPSGQLGAQVTTVTSWPARAQRTVCSYVRVAGALPSGGK
jgi:hypothetical protein